MTPHRAVAGRLFVLTALLAGCTFHASPRPIGSRVQLVQVDKNVRDEVVDWGGKGPTLVLLAGGGNTAHVFDDFAPRLTAYYRVIGITRRGFGTSTFAPVNTTSRLADDVLAVMDTLSLRTAFLGGHSVAGAELSALGAAHPERIRGLIYIEAGYPYAFRMRNGPTMKEFMDVNGGGPPSPTPPDTSRADFGALQRWDARTFGFETPASEFRQLWDSTQDGRPTKARDPAGAAGLMVMLSDTTTQAILRVPSLIIFAIPHTHEPWMDARNPEGAATYFAGADALAERQEKAIEQNVSNARVIRMRGMHYLFLSNTTDVIREIRAFTARLN